MKIHLLLLAKRHLTGITLNLRPCCPACFLSNVPMVEKWIGFSRKRKSSVVNRRLWVSLVKGESTRAQAETNTSPGNENDLWPLMQFAARVSEVFMPLPRFLSWQIHQESVKGPVRQLSWLTWSMLTASHAASYLEKTCCSLSVQHLRDGKLQLDGRRARM